MARTDYAPVVPVRLPLSFENGGPMSAVGAAAGTTTRAQAYRSRSADVTLEVTRALCTVLGMATLLSTDVPDDMRSPALVAHTAVLVASLTVLALLPTAVRRGRASELGALATGGTLVFFVVYSVAWHDVAHAASLLGVLALVEAPIRYGRKGLPYSAAPVTAAALLWPQRDASGEVQSPLSVVLLVMLLCGLVLVVREATHRSARALASAAEGFAEAMLHLPLGVAVLDAGGRVLQANPALDDLLGREVRGAVLLDRFPLQDRAQLVDVLAGRRPDDRVDSRTDDGRWVQVGAGLLRAPGPPRTVVHVQDVTSARQERADLLHASRHDALTGLLVRSAGQQVLEEALRDDGAAVLFVDLDGFKHLNDTAGHGVGDVVLRQVAARLAGCLRPTEQAIRWGGDEFVVVCRDIADSEALEVVAERLLRVLREPFRVPDIPLLALTGSVGGVLAGRGDDPTAVLSLADRAMYSAKQQGGDRWERGRATATWVAAPRSPAERDDARAG